MSKRSRKTGLIGKENFAQQDVAKAFGKGLINDAIILGIVENSCKAIEKCNGTQALNTLEIKHLRLAIEDLETTRQRLLSIGRRVQRRGGAA